MSNDVTDKAVTQRAYTPLPIDAKVISSEQTMWDAFKQQKQVSADPTLKDWFVTDFNAVIAAATAKAEKESA